MPNTLVTIEVRVTSYEYKYTGLIMDAVRTTAGGNGTTQEMVVGRFVFPEKREGLFWEPPNCNGSGKVLRKEGFAPPYTHTHTPFPRSLARAAITSANLLPPLEVSLPQTHPAAPSDTPHTAVRPAPE
jgi:hypothetical protein